MKATFTISNPRLTQPLVVVAQLPVTVGRGPEADLKLPDSWVSRRHCRIEDVAGEVIVRDLDSKYGTMLNRELIHEARLPKEAELFVGLTNVRVSLDASNDSMVGLAAH